MSSKNYELRPLQWDTDYFGVSSARVNLGGIVDEKGQEEIIRETSEMIGEMTRGEEGEKRKKVAKKMRSLKRERKRHEIKR